MASYSDLIERGLGSNEPTTSYAGKVVDAVGQIGGHYAKDYEENKELTPGEKWSALVSLGYDPHVASIYARGGHMPEDVHPELAGSTQVGTEAPRPQNVPQVPFGPQPVLPTGGLGTSAPQTPPPDQAGSIGYNLPQPIPNGLRDTNPASMIRTRKDYDAAMQAGPFVYKQRVADINANGALERTRATNGVRVSEGEANRDLRKSEGEANRGTREDIASKNNATKIAVQAARDIAAMERLRESLRGRMDQISKSKEGTGKDQLLDEAGKDVRDLRDSIVKIRTSIAQLAGNPEAAETVAGLNKDLDEAEQEYTQRKSQLDSLAAKRAAQRSSSTETKVNVPAKKVTADQLNNMFGR
jgi:hypothetical protein